MDGLETHRRIAKVLRGQRVIITTGYAETAKIKEALQSGIGRCLKKPYLINDISLAARANSKSG
jgi:two-component system cell cycle sensor histidine kinase/response regulator CckA